MPVARCRRAVLTVNNWTEEEYTKLLRDFEACKYIIGKEVGGEDGTPHLQCYFEFPGQKTYASLRKLVPRGHWEKAKGNRVENIVYCSKEGDFVSNFPLPRRQRLLAQYMEVVWKPWQQDIVDIIEGPVDRRKLHWFHEPVGNTGKSFLAKYLFLKYDAIVCEGVRNDVFNQVKMWMEAHEDDQDPGVVIVDVPRCVDHISWHAIESLKSGMLYSGKYEGGVCVFEIPHVICFANVPPDLSRMSQDRWDIHLVPPNVMDGPAGS